MLGLGASRKDTRGHQQLNASGFKARKKAALEHGSKIMTQVVRLECNFAANTIKPITD
jgi:hypothetical protein